MKPHSDLERENADLRRAVAMLDAKVRQQDTLLQAAHADGLAVVKAEYRRKLDIARDAGNMDAECRAQIVLDALGNERYGG